jgi:HlyD family secretion protein
VKRTGVVILVSVFVLALLLALIRPAGSSPDAGKSGAKNQGGISFALGAAGPRRVEVLTPRRGPIASRIEAPGTVRAGSEVGIGARFEGTVLELVKDVGDPVQEGEVVFRLDPTDKQELVSEAEIDVTLKQGALAEAEAELAEAQRRFEDARREPSNVTEARLMLRQSELSSERANAQKQSADTRLARAESMQEAGIGLKIEVETARDEQRVATISARIADEELKLARETLAFRVRTWEEARAEAAKNLEVARVRRDRAKADLQASELGLEQAQRDLSRCEIKTPLSGVITGRGINQGDLVSRMTADVAHYIVSDLEHLLVYADVDEGDVVKVARGQPATVGVNALGDDRELSAAVYDVGYRADESGETATFRVRVLLEPGQEGHARLRPGMSASVEVTVAQNASALKVPLQGVVQREVQELPDELEKTLELDPTDLVDVVYVVVDGEAKVRLVELGIQDDDEAEVLSGLQADESVIVGPFRALEDLRDGRAVTSEEAKDVLPPDSESDVAPVESATGE